MNRSNVGNQITNGMQILSVAATTGSKVFSLGKANQALNNEGKSDSDLLKQENLKARTENLKLKNEKLKSENQIKTIDDILANNGVSYNQNSEQINDIQTKISRDSNFLEMWKQSLREPEPLETLIKSVTGGNENADL